MSVAGGLAVRVDGGRGVGMGHVIRSLALVEALRVAWQLSESRCVFYMRDVTAGVDAVRQAGYPVVLLGEEEEPLATSQRLLAQRPGLLLVDLYDVGAAYVNMLRDASDATTVCLTDLDNTEPSCDVLVNGFVGLGESRIEHRADGTHALLGPNYKVLRPQFADQRPHEIRPRIERVLVTTGGWDKAGISLMALRALHCHRRRLDIGVLLGTAYEQHHDVQYLIRNHRHPVKAHEHVEHMAERLRWADLAISGGGDTVYEIAACGAPAIVLCHVAHQLATARAFEERGAIVNLGLAADTDERALIDCIEALDADVERRRALSENGQQLVDGRGTARVTEAILNVHARRIRNRGTAGG